MFVEKDVAMDKNVVQGAWVIWACTPPRHRNRVCLCLSFPSPSPAAAAAARQQMQGRFPVNIAIWKFLCTPCCVLFAAHGLTLWNGRLPVCDLAQISWTCV